VPGTSKKNVKRPNTPQNQKPKRKRGGRTSKKAKKGVSPEIWQALLLTAVLIIVSVAVSMVALGIKQKGQPVAVSGVLPEVAIPEIAAPENAPVQDTPAREAAVPKPPQEKQAPAAVPKPPQKQTPVPVPKTAAEKATATSRPETRQPAKTSTVNIPASAGLPPEQPPKPKPQQQGTLVFVIDDAGNNLQELEPFLRFPGPLTIAVLPGLPHSAEAARRIRAAGKEVFLHQPMEAIGGQAPGPGAIYAGMNTAEIVAVLSKNIAEIGPVAGMNNHQGSKVTMDQQIMETVLAFCREQGICFLDSRTTAETAVPAAARNLGMKIRERAVFIDNEQDRLSMDRSIEGGLTRASQRGNAVMIGHTWSPELAPLLAGLYQDFIAQGYVLATASKLIN
jgi:polysaccharide deacetylase 2 family uncharacterized protein YibQ